MTKKKKRKRKKIHECAFKNNQLTQLLHLWLQSRLNDFTAFPPLAPSGKTSGKKKKKKKTHEGGGYGNTNSLLERTATELNLHPTPSTGSSLRFDVSR